MSNDEQKQKVTQQSERAASEASSDHAPRQRKAAYQLCVGNPLVIENFNGIFVCECHTAATATIVVNMLNFAQKAAQEAAGLGGL